MRIINKIMNSKLLDFATILGFTSSSNSSKEEDSETLETKPVGILLLLVAFLFNNKNIRWT